jgi:nicotinamide-nucleotide amidase
MKSHDLLSEDVGRLLLKNQLVLATAESCTGGGVATVITDIAGSSAWFDRAFVTYSNQAKMEMLNVSSRALELNGAVSEPVAVEMVLGALAHSAATIAVSISGIAGPSGGTENKPVGTVCFAWADHKGWLQVHTVHYQGDRRSIRDQAVTHALEELKRHLLQ